MGNKNLTYKWWKNNMADKIVIEKEILIGKIQYVVFTEYLLEKTKMFIVRM